MWGVGAGNGDKGDREGGLSASAQKRINSTRSNGLTAKRAHRGAAPRGREGVGEGREKGRRVGEGVGTGAGGRAGTVEEKGGGRGEKRRKGQRESGKEGTGRDSLRGGVSLTSLHPSTLGRRNLSGTNQTPQPPGPLALTLPLSRQGAARPCVVSADLRASKLGLK